MSNMHWMQLTVSFSLLVCTTVGAAEIRLYTIDKFGRQDNVSLWGKSAKPGCHNFRRPKAIYRVAVIGKGACAIYSEPDCASRSKIPAQWKNRKKATTLLTPGSQWLFGEKEKVVEIKPEVDSIPVPESAKSVTETSQERREETATDGESTVSEVEVGGYKIEQKDKLRNINTGPRLEAIHIPLTTDVRSWQCVDKY